MNAVGIDVSKGKSMVAVMRPCGEVALASFLGGQFPQCGNGREIALKEAETVFGQILRRLTAVAYHFHNVGFPRNRGAVPVFHGLQAVVNPGTEKNAGERLLFANQNPRASPVWPYKYSGLLCVSDSCASFFTADIWRPSVACFVPSPARKQCPAFSNNGNFSPIISAHLKRTRSKFHASERKK